MGSEPLRVLRNARLVLPERILDGDLLVRGGFVESLGPPGKGDGDEIWELAGKHVAAGLIDTHTHGGWGIDFATDPPDRIIEAAPLYARVGVTRLLVTVYPPGPEADLLDSVANAAKACLASPSALVGIHLEGPFLARDRKGALPEAGILDYDDGLMERIFDAAAGQLRVMTFAPEAIPVDAMQRIQSLGVHLSVGHTSANAAETRTAIDAGVRRATHLCNAMPPIHHRDPGPIVPLLRDARVRTEVIADGQHLDDDVLALILECKGPDGVLAVSDSMPFTGMGPATGEFAGATVMSDGERAMQEGGTLAGSVTPLLSALRRTGAALGLSVERLWRLGATVPAADLPLSNLGRVASGCPADLLVLDDDDTVLAALRGGRRADVDADSDSSWLPDGIERVR